MNSVSGMVLRLGKQAVACTLVYFMIPLGVADVFAQEAPPPPPPDQQQQQQYDQQQQYQQGPDQGAPDQEGPPPQQWNALSPDQLGQMVAPIALYPDSLVAQILAASTFPSQVVDADRFVQSHPGVPPDQLGPMIDSMPWDPSVKALVAFPSVLSNLDKNLDWTSQLGNAYYNQPQDVMAAVQTMRQRAYQAGNLRTNQQLDVTYDPGNIVIAPVNPAVVYVPYYNPWGVYGAPIVAWGGYYPPPRPAGLFFAAGIGLGFGIGIAIGGWNHWGWGWHNWGMGWHDRTVVFNRNVYVSRSVTVVNHGYYGHFDRAPGARAFNRNLAVRSGAYHGGGNFNRPGGNNFNRPGGNNFHGNGGNNFNRPSGNNNFNHPGGNNNFNRPGGNNNFNRPSNGGFNGNRPGGSNNFNRPNTNTARPSGGSSNFNRPNNNARPAMNNSHPTASHPAPQSHGSAPHSNGGGHPSGGGGGHHR